MPINIFYEIFKDCTLLEKRRKVKEILERKYRYKEFSYELIDEILTKSYIDPLYEIFMKNNINDYNAILNLPNLEIILEEFEKKLKARLENL